MSFFGSTLLVKAYYRLMNPKHKTMSVIGFALLIFVGIATALYLGSLKRNSHAVAPSASLLPAADAKWVCECSCYKAPNDKDSYLCAIPRKPDGECNDTQYNLPADPNTDCKLLEGKSCSGYELQNIKTYGTLTCAKDPVAVSNPSAGPNTTPSGI